MNRRNFLRSLFLTGAALSSPALWPSIARADYPPNDRPVLVNITLRGGPDFRHLLVPPPSDQEGTYGQAYWNNRWRAHGVGSNLSDWQGRYQDDYLATDHAGQQFGILGRAGWLKSQFDAGNVAFINNVAGAITRDHNHGELVWESGDRSTTANQLTRDGWGGRLAAAIDGNVVSMTSPVRLFCNGPHPTNPEFHDNSRVITARDTRNMAFFEPDALTDDPGNRGTQAVLSRGLSSYYAAKVDDMPEDSPYSTVVQHERRIREFGELVDARLATVPLPPAIEALYDGEETLNVPRFGEQIRNLYDSLACSDIFNFRVGSLMLSGWDSHRDQRDVIEPMFEDLFGTGGGLDTLFSELAVTMPDAADNLVVVLGGDFGRQLAANGDQGTDHGRGNTVIVIGNPVAGGVYGELFPESEIERFSQSSADIQGLTALEQIFAQVCDWVEPGAGATVYPDLSDAEVEANVALAALFGG